MAHHRMSEDAHTVYVERRRNDRDITLERKRARHAKLTLRGAGL